MNKIANDHRSPYINMKFHENSISWNKQNKFQITIVMSTSIYRLQNYGEDRYNSTILYYNQLQIIWL